MNPLSGQTLYKHKINQFKLNSKILQTGPS